MIATDAHSMPAKMNQRTRGMTICRSLLSAALPEAALRSASPAAVDFLLSVTATSQAKAIRPN
jgi:hypothetical protein